MNTKIKLFGVTAMTISALFAGAGLVSAQTATVASCSSATLNATLSDTGGAQTSAWFEYGTSFSVVDSGVGSRTTTQVFNAPQSFSQVVSGLNQSTTYYYRAVFSNIYGTSNGGALSFTTPPCAVQTYTQQTVTTNSASSVSQNSATLNGYVTPNGANTNAWFEWGTSAYYGNTTTSINYGTNATSYNNTITGLTVNTTYYYRAVAQNSQGTVYGSSLSFTTTGQTYNYNYNYNTNVGSAPTVNTLLVTEKTGTTAKLNGLVFESNSQSSNAYFEWGPTASLGNKTTTTNVGNLSVVKHSGYVTGLVSGHTYYYRVVAQNLYGTSYGAVNSFVSQVSTYAVTPVVTVVTHAVLKPTTTVVTSGSSEQSLVSLSIEGGAEMIGAGEKRTYYVKWKNESTQSLKDVVLRVTFPASINIDSSTKGAFSSTDNSVVVDLKTLASKEGGEAFIFATSGRSLRSGEVLVVTANMVYTGTNGAQGDAVAYVMHRAETTQNVISANIFGTGSFVPSTIFEWILLLILVLILVLLGNHLYGRFSYEKH